MLWLPAAPVGLDEGMPSLFRCLGVPVPAVTTVTASGLTVTPPAVDVAPAPGPAAALAAAAPREGDAGVTILVIQYFQWNGECLAVRKRRGDEWHAVFVGRCRTSAKESRLSKMAFQLQAKSRRNSTRPWTFRSTCRAGAGISTDSRFQMLAKASQAGPMKFNDEWEVKVRAGKVSC